MKTGVDQMKCGGCGNDKFRVYAKDESVELLVECTKCKSVNTISAKAVLKKDWEGTGGLCFMS